MRNCCVSEKATLTPGRLSDAEVNRIRGYPTTTLPKSTVTLGSSTGATASGHTSLIRLKAPLGVSCTAVMVMRTLVPDTGVGNATARWMTSLSDTVAANCQAPFVQTSTVKSVGTPSLLETSVIPENSRAAGTVMVSVSGNTPSVSSFQKVSGLPSMALAAS